MTVEHVSEGSFRGYDSSVVLTCDSQFSTKPYQRTMHSSIDIAKRTMHSSIDIATEFLKNLVNLNTDKLSEILRDTVPFLQPVVPFIISLLDRSPYPNISILVLVATCIGYRYVGKSDIYHCSLVGLLTVKRLASVAEKSVRTMTGFLHRFTSACYSGLRSSSCFFRSIVCWCHSTYVWLRHHRDIADGKEEIEFSGDWGKEHKHEEGWEDGRPRIKIARSDENGHRLNPPVRLHPEDFRRLKLLMENHMRRVENICEKALAVRGPKSSCDEKMNTALWKDPEVDKSYSMGESMSPEGDPLNGCGDLYLAHHD